MQMNTETLNKALERYSSRLAETRPQEVYKWKATKHFLDTFDLNAANLGANIEEALSEAGNLLTGGSWFPKGMLERFADTYPDDTRAALTHLFDEDVDLRQRMVDFEKWAEKVLDAINEPAVQKGESIAKNHYQDTRSMSVYLSFHNAGEHYLYKTTIYTFVAKVLGLPRCSASSIPATSSTRSSPTARCARRFLPSCGVSGQTSWPRAMRPSQMGFVPLTPTTTCSCRTSSTS